MRQNVSLNAGNVASNYTKLAWQHKDINFHIIIKYVVFVISKIISNLFDCASFFCLKTTVYILKLCVRCAGARFQCSLCGWRECCNAVRPASGQSTESHYNIMGWFEEGAGWYCSGHPGISRNRTRLGEEIKFASINRSVQ